MLIHLIVAIIKLLQRYYHTHCQIYRLDRTNQAYLWDPCEVTAKPVIGDPTNRTTAVQSKDVATAVQPIVANCHVTVLYARKVQSNLKSTVQRVRVIT